MITPGWVAHQGAGRHILSAQSSSAANCSNTEIRRARHWLMPSNGHRSGRTLPLRSATWTIRAGAFDCLDLAGHGPGDLSLKGECIRPGTLLSLDDARRGAGLRRELQHRQAE